MEKIPFHPLLQVSDEEMMKVRQFHNLDRKQIQENIEAIEEWIKKQDHLVEGYKYMSRGMLERLHLLAKGSVEATKIKIDKTFTARVMMPELILNKTYEEFEEFLDHVIYVPIPKLNPKGQSRILVSQLIDDNVDNFTILTYLRYCAVIGEFRFNYDYCISDTIIIDLKNIKMNILTKLNPVVIKKGEIFGTKVYGLKINGIHFLNAPPFVDRIVNILKQVLSVKVASRVHVHNSYESLHEHVSKEILPKEYGGDGPSAAKISELWKDYLRSEEGRKVLEESEKLISDESKRNSATFNDEYLGMPGSFKTLNVD